MKIKDKINIKDLYFGYVNYPMSYSSSDEKTQLKVYNLFDSTRVSRAVALYVLMTPAQRKERVKDPLSWCFSDVWGRCEYEFVMNPWPYNENDKISNGHKVDIWTMYVEPNKELLLDLVNRVTKSSARAYLKSLKSLK